MRAWIDGRLKAYQIDVGKTLGLFLILRSLYQFSSLVILYLLEREIRVDLGLLIAVIYYRVGKSLLIHDLRAWRWANYLNDGTTLFFVLGSILTHHIDGSKLTIMGKTYLNPSLWKGIVFAFLEIGQWWLIRCVLHSPKGIGEFFPEADATKKVL